MKTSTAKTLVENDKGKAPIVLMAVRSDEATIVDIGDKCVECKNDTSFGSGRFVNRIPAGNDEFDGYLCTECRLMTCDKCGEEVVEYGGFENMILCDDCYPEEEEDEEAEKKVDSSPQLF